MPKILPKEPTTTAKTALYLGQYVMEAVGFTEFIFEEAIQTGFAALKVEAIRHNSLDYRYLRQKFLDEVFMPGYNFHLRYGPLNPFTWIGFECFYKKAWKDLAGMGMSGYQK